MPAVAIVAAGAIAAGASIYSSNKASKAQTSAAGKVADTERYIYDENKRLFEPFYEVGKNALSGLSGYDATHPTPSYDELVYNPMESWNYEQSPAYKAKYSLGMGELNKQLQARGLSSSAIGGNRAVDLSRKLTAEDYDTERRYETGRRTDRYKGQMSENTDAYNRLLDQVRIGQGAASSLGSAGNQYASGVGQATMAEGEAKAGFYAGLPGAVLNTTATGLKAYDTGQRAGWWGGGGDSNTNNLPTMPDSDNYNYSGSYNF